MKKNARNNNVHPPEVELGSISYNNQISVPKARRILGSLSKDMSDNQVRELVQTLHLIARDQLCYIGSKK